jgi:GntR family transcriptional regulator / MocR family aminotransferase
MPTSLQSDFEKFNTYQKSTVSRIDQQVVAKFMEEGHYTAHIAKMRTLYRAKRNCLIENITKHLGEEFEVMGDAAGIHIIIKLPDRLNESTAIELAKSKGIEIDSVSTSYQYHKPSHQVMLGYGAPNLDEIQRGVTLLGNVWKNNLSN